MRGSVADDLEVVEAVVAVGVVKAVAATVVAVAGTVLDGDVVAAPEWVDVPDEPDV